MKNTSARTDWRIIAICILLAPFSLMAGSNQAGNAWAWGLSILANGSLQTPAIVIGSVAGDLATPAVGALWYDSNRKAFRGNADFGIAGLSLLFTPPIADSGTLSNPTSATAFSTKVPLPANCLSAGKMIRGHAFGRYTTGTAITPTLNIGVNVGGAVLANSGAVPTIISLTNQGWDVEFGFTVRTAGAGGTMFGWTRASLGGLLAAALPTTMVGRSGSKAVDTTQARDVEVTGSFGSSDAANAITLEGLEVEACN